jgi:hypothetical protein
MARTSIAKPGGRGVREVDLVFERVTEKPVKVGNEWTTMAVDDEQFALYRDSGTFPRKMYLSREEAEELLGLIAEELDLKVRFETR